MSKFHQTMCSNMHTRHVVHTTKQKAYHNSSSTEHMNMTLGVLACILYEDGCNVDFEHVW